MNQDTRIRRALEQEGEDHDLRPDLEDLRRRFARRSRRRTLGTTLVGAAMGVFSVVAAVSLVGALGDREPSPEDRPVPRTGIPTDPPGGVNEVPPKPHAAPASEGLPEGTLVIQKGPGVAILRAGSDHVERVAGSLFAWDVSPDGSLILASDRALVAIDRNGERKVLFEAGESDHLQADPVWSPDGSMIAYSIGSQDPADRSTPCVLVLSTDESECFPDVGRVFTLDWSPDGRSIVAAGPSSQPLYRIDVVTGEVSAMVGQQGDTPINRELEVRGWGPSMQLVGPTWSPSGRYLAALANMDQGPYSYVPVIFTSDGTVVAFGRPSTDFPGAFAWSPVEDLLAYTQGGPAYRITEVYVLDPDTGKERHLVTSDGKEYPHVTDLAWSPSGRWLALTLWWADLGYLQEAQRIIEATSGEAVEEFEIDTGEVLSPLVDWAP
jgi:dipeptidyl aminopeptidase/acylaminoacyl peptidase